MKATGNKNCKASGRRGYKGWGAQLSVSVRASVCVCLYMCVSRKTRLQQHKTTKNIHQAVTTLISFTHTYTRARGHCETAHEKGRAEAAQGAAAAAAPPAAAAAVAEAAQCQSKRGPHTIFCLQTTGASARGSKRGRAGTHHNRCPLREREW